MGSRFLNKYGNQSNKINEKKRTGFGEMNFANFTFLSEIGINESLD